VERFTIGIIILFTNHMSITQLQKKALTHWTLLYSWLLLREISLISLRFKLRIYIKLNLVQFTMLTRTFHHLSRVIEISRIQLGIKGLKQPHTCQIFSHQMQLLILTITVVLLKPMITDKSAIL
jgi:hypothetical protein